jgi:methionine-rich copper-binding protein CopC
MKPEQKQNTEPIMQRMLITLALSFLLLGLVPGGDASAHARLERANPAPEAVIDTPPSEIRIWTTQELTLSGNSVAVLDAAGNRVDNGDARVDQSDPNRKQIAVTVPPLANGTYTVNFTLSSAEDGHSADDSYWFTVEAAGATNPRPMAARPVSAMVFAD